METKKENIIRTKVIKVNKDAPDSLKVAIARKNKLKELIRSGNTTELEKQGISLRDC